MNFIAWIILGGVSGWLASIVMRTNKSMGKISNIIVGIIGASIGGFIYHLFGASGVTGFNWHSLWVSVVGSIILLLFVKLIRR